MNKSNKKLLNNRKGQSRSLLLVGLLVYLSALTFFFSAMGATYGDSLPNYSSLKQEIPGGFLLDIVTGVSVVPTWINIIFILIPVGILVYLLIVAIVPTTNAGA